MGPKLAMKRMTVISFGWEILLNSREENYSSAKKVQVYILYSVGILEVFSVPSLITNYLSQNRSLRTQDTGNGWTATMTITVGEWTLPYSLSEDTWIIWRKHRIWSAVGYGQFYCDFEFILKRVE